MIVVDTSAVVGVLTGQPKVPGLIDRLVGDGDRHAPHLIDVEFQHALRRLVIAGAISDDRAADARMDFADLAIIRYPHLSGGSDVGASPQNVCVRCGVPRPRRGPRSAARDLRWSTLSRSRSRSPRRGVSQRVVGIAVAISNPHMPQGAAHGDEALWP